MEEVQKLGRPTKFTPELGHAICRAIERVGHEALAAEICGVHRHTVRHWRDRGDEGEEPFVEFARELAKAKALHIESKLSGVKSMEWLLERLDREIFSAPQKHEVSGRGGKAIEFAPPVLSKQAARGLIQGILGADDEGDA